LANNIEPADNPLPYKWEVISRWPEDFEQRLAFGVLLKVLGHFGAELFYCFHFGGFYTAKISRGGLA
jgi:hypothetical protein